MAPKKKGGSSTSAENVVVKQEIQENHPQNDGPRNQDPEVTPIEREFEYSRVQAPTDYAIYQALREIEEDPLTHTQLRELLRSSFKNMRKNKICETLEDDYHDNLPGIRQQLKKLKDKIEDISSKEEKRIDVFEERINELEDDFDNPEMVFEEIDLPLSFVATDALKYAANRPLDEHSLRSFIKIGSSDKLQGIRKKEIRDQLDCLRDRLIDNEAIENYNRKFITDRIEKLIKALT